MYSKYILGFLLFGLLLFAGCVEETPAAEPEGEDQGEEEEEEVEVVDCGTDQSCFEPYFESCTPAKFKATLGATVAYEYEIVGPEEGGCAVKTWYSANPNPEWVDKEMVCVYDNTLEFLTSVEEGFLQNCEGELYDYLMNL